MKDNKNNRLPKKWEWKKLEEVSEVVTGNTPPKNDDANYGGNIPFVKPPQLRNTIVFDAPEKISVKGAKKARILPTGSTLVSCIGNLGRTAFNTKEVATNQQINAIIPNNDYITNKFIFYVAQSHIFRNQLEGLASATTLPIVNKGKFLSISIPVPSLLIQNKIVEKIEELFSDLDYGIENLKKVKEQLKVYRQAVLSAAFSGKLTEDLINASTRLLNNELNLVELGKYAFVTKLAGFEFTKYVKYKDKGEIPVIRAQNVNKFGFIERNFIYVDRSIMEKLPRSRIYGGEILMVFVGAGLGNVGIVPLHKEYFLGPNVAKIDLKEEFYNRYIFHYLSSTRGFGKIFKMSKATAQGSISMANIRTIEVPLISLEKQQKIVEEVETRLSVCDKIEETIEESLIQSDSLRQSILKQAFEGKLVN